MLELTLKGGSIILVDPAHIASIKTQGDVTVVYQPGDENPWRVTETLADVARLKAAWEQRFAARELRGSLPIAVAFDAGADEGRGAILFKCCQITERLRQEREASRALSRRQFLRFWRR